MTLRLVSTKTSRQRRRPHPGAAHPDSCTMAPAACAHQLGSSKTVREALLGAAASSAACVVSNPLDTIRVRLQLQQGRGSLPESPLRAMAVVAQREGPLVLWRSLPEAVAYNAVLNSVRFSLYSALTGGTVYAVQEERMSPPVAGFIAGAIAGAVASPFAKARTVAQRQAAGSAGGVQLSRLVAGAKAAAPSKLGWGAAASWSLRNGGHTGIIFSCYEHFRWHLAAAFPSLPGTVHSLSASLAASSLSCVAVNPMDVVATRLFAQSAPQRAVALSASSSCSAAAIATPVYSSPLDVVVKTVLADGVPGLYRGLGANIARVVPHTCITFAIVEALRARISKR